MICRSCNTNNPQNAKFCNNCGEPLIENFQTCVNGHNYDASLSKCPFCPSSDYSQIVKELTEEETVLETDDNATTLDTSQPQLTNEISTKILDNDKTVLIGSSEPTLKPNIQGRKLVGWLVTFDLNPIGVDFRLYEGRNVIGRSNSNDIIINDRTVSEKHCTILYRNGKFLISDELSTNGTFVNGELIENHKYLNDNDIIKIGKVSFKLRVI